MDFQEIRTVVSCLFFLALAHFPLSGQEKDKPDTEPTGLLQLVQEEYGPDQILFNGIYPENIYRNALGHPFLGENKFFPGHLVAHKRLFDNIYLKYDIFDQNIIITQNPDSENPVKIIPPNKFISEFGINTRLFRKYRGDDGKDRFFQVVYDGEIKCLETWTKERVESFHTEKYSSFRFKDETKKSYLLIDQKFCSFSTLNSFLKYFPKEMKPDLKKFFSTERINLASASDEQIKKLFSFCENLLEKYGKISEHQSARTN